MTGSPTLALADNVQQLQQIPELGPLYARAVLARKRSVSELAGDRLRVSDQPIEADQLRRYQQLCGFRVSAELPPTYLHLMAFPLSVARMVRSDFPFPLLGLVHLNNTICQYRPVTAAEPVSITAWAANLREHPAGQLVDLVSEARVGGELVWAETSSYLRRQSGGDRPTSRERAETTQPSGPANRWRAEADIGRRYAAISGDRNPIHLHDLTAKAFGFRSAIAHGLWLKARMLAAFEGTLPDEYTVDVAFKTPVFLPSTVELRADRISDGGEPGWTVAVNGVRSGKPHLAGAIQPKAS